MIYYYLYIKLYSTSYTFLLFCSSLEHPVMKFHWLKILMLLARDQLGAFSLSLMYFQSPKCLDRAKKLINNNYF